MFVACRNLGTQDNENLDCTVETVSIRRAVTMAAINLINLTKYFGPLKAVNDLTLTISDKEFVALLGPSGCGKTTTMNMISGIEQPTAGKICFNGIDIGRVPPAAGGSALYFRTTLYSLT